MRLKQLTNPLRRFLGRGLVPAAALMLVLAGCGSGSSPSPTAGTSLKATATPASAVANCLGKDTPLNQAPKATADLWRHVNEMADESKALVAACSEVNAPVPSAQTHNLSSLSDAAAQKLIGEFMRNVTWQNWAAARSQFNLVAHLSTNNGVLAQLTTALQNGDVVTGGCPYPAKVSLVKVPAAAASHMSGGLVAQDTVGVAYAYVGACPDTVTKHTDGTSHVDSLAAGQEQRELVLVTPLNDPVLGDVGILAGFGDATDRFAGPIIQDSGI